MSTDIITLQFEYFSSSCDQVDVDKYGTVWVVDLLDRVYYYQNGEWTLDPTAEPGGNQAPKTGLSEVWESLFHYLRTKSTSRGMVPRASMWSS